MKQLAKLKSINTLETNKQKSLVPRSVSQKGFSITD